MHNDYKNKHKAMYRMKWNRLSIIGLLTAMCGMQMGCSDADDMLDSIANESEQTTAPFLWTRAEDVETHSEFLRNFGVGYSYDAVRGAYCSWEDIRCQVLNRRELEKRNKIGPDMLVSQKKEAFETKQAVRYSQRDYVQSMDLTTKEEIDIGLYKKTKRNRQYVLEEGLHDCFYYMVQDNITKGEQYFTPAEVQEKINQECFENDKSDLLTLSFQDAIKHLAWCNPKTDYAVVDSFINVWGTHVITRAMLGATMQLTLKNDMWRYKDNVSTQAFTTEELLTAYKNRKSARHQQESYTWTEQSSLYIECRGGEQSYMGTMIGEAKYDGTRDFDMSDLSKWRESVTFNPNKEKESNCEMVYMEVEPIWNFVPEEYAHVKNWLKAAILQDAALYQEMLGDRNFFSTKFPIRPTSVSCQWRKETSSWQTHHGGQQRVPLLERTRRLTRWTALGQRGCPRVLRQRAHTRHRGHHGWRRRCHTAHVPPHDAGHRDMLQRMQGRGTAGAARRAGAHRCQRTGVLVGRRPRPRPRRVSIQRLCTHLPQADRGPQRHHHIRPLPRAVQHHTWLARQHIQPTAVWLGVFREDERVPTAIVTGPHPPSLKGRKLTPSRR